MNNYAFNYKNKRQPVIRAKMRPNCRFLLIYHAFPRFFAYLLYRLERLLYRHSHTVKFVLYELAFFSRKPLPRRRLTPLSLSHPSVSATPHFPLKTQKNGIFTRHL